MRTILSLSLIIVIISAASPKLVHAFGSINSHNSQVNAIAMTMR